MQPVGGVKVDVSRMSVFVLSGLRTTSVTFFAARHAGVGRGDDVGVERCSERPSAPRERLLAQSVTGPPVLTMQVHSAAMLGVVVGEAYGWCR